MMNDRELKEYTELQRKVRELQDKLESRTSERNGLLRQSSEFDAPMIKSLAKENLELESKLDAMREENSAIRYIITSAIKNLKEGAASKHTDNEKLMLLVVRHLKIALEQK